LINCYQGTEAKIYLFKFLLFLFLKNYFKECKLNFNILEEKKKDKRGRNSKWNVIVKNYDKIIELARNGFTDIEISRYIGINPDTFFNYKKKYPEFADALANAKDKADHTVINKLFQRACGYDYEEEQIEYTPTKNKKTEIKNIKKIKKHLPPEYKAQVFWLINRRRKDWTQPKDYEMTINENINIPDFENMSDEELKKLIERELNNNND